MVLNIMLSVCGKVIRLVLINFMVVIVVVLDDCSSVVVIVLDIVLERGVWVVVWM